MAGYEGSYVVVMSASPCTVVSDGVARSLLPEAFPLKSMLPFSFDLAVPEVRFLYVPPWNPQQK